MPRSARKKCDSGIYHIMLRGINRQDIFYDEEDYQRFREIMNNVKGPGKCEIYGYCLMANHVHLLLQEKEAAISTIMKRIGTSYAWWYNKKYDREGHVFQDRYKSETIEDEQYLLSVLRYIHSNPVKARLVPEPEQYKWSSCGRYYGEPECPPGLTDTAFILGIIADNEEAAIAQLKEYTKHENSDKFLDIEVKPKKSDESLYQDIQALLNGQPVTVLQTMDKQKRDEIIRQAKKIEGATQRQIARVTGINQSIVFKA